MKFYVFCTLEKKRRNKEIEKWRNGQKKIMEM